ncbi:MAG: mechanosensitive ion channel family protein, partial [Bacteroidia bacterium]|nr:mechanosensitive ion channel family protein [Bacteroidia bacterium]
MNIEHLLYDYLVETGMAATTAKYLNMIALLLGLLIIAFLIDYIIRKIIIKFFNQLAVRTKTNFDNFLVKNKAPRNIAHIIPLILVFEFIPIVLVDFPNFENIAEKGLRVFAIILT